MKNKLFVGSLPWAVDDAQLTELFSKHGQLVSARVIRDRETGRSRGFGIVEFSGEEDAQKAIDALDQSELGGRTINVSVAREQQR